METAKMTETVNHFQLQSILEDQFLEDHNLLCATKLSLHSILITYIIVFEL